MFATLALAGCDFVDGDTLHEAADGSTTDDGASDETTADVVTPDAGYDVEDSTALPLGFGDPEAEGIHENPGSSPSKIRENNRLTGRYPEVMYIKDFRSDGMYNCTGTVVAPYAVLTAHHCIGENSQTQVDWWGDVTFPVARVFRNPYLYAQYVPAWWTALNKAQKAVPGGRQDDWPAQHDQVILFVPNLTPEFLRDNRITPAAIRPTSGASNFNVVGVGSTGGEFRDWIATKFVTAVANSITVSRRDGYLSRDLGAANFGNVDPGDSGGPSLGSFFHAWTGGTTYESGRYIVGTTQNNGESGLSPLAYDPGIAMTVNQKLTVRVNALWAQARMDDPDGDGLPSLCDLEPTVENISNGNRCPAAIGGPSGVLTAQLPTAQLTCKPGYLAVGLRGRSGDLIDRLAVQCRALSCFDGSSNTCAGNSTYEYWTDEFGGDGGGPFTRSCPSGKVLVGVDAKHDMFGGLIHSIAPRCATYTNALASVGAVDYQGPLAGHPTNGAAALRDCPAGEVLVGFQARSHVTNFLTGLQPICSADPVRYRWYTGGQGGGDTALTCPTGQRAIGTVQNTHPDNAINAFGLLCAPNGMTGASAPDSQITVVHGGFWHYGAGLQAPAAAEPRTSVHLPPNAIYHRCQGYLLGVQARHDGIVWSIDSMRCSEGSTANSYTVKPVNIGNQTMGFARVQSCPDLRPVDGLFIRSGWLTNGFALHCR